MRKTSVFAQALIAAAALVVIAVPSSARAQCNGGMRGSGGMSSGMGGTGMGGSMAMGPGMGGSGMGTNSMMMQQQLQAMQQQMMQMQMVQQAMLERMEEMSGRTLNVNGSGRSSARTANHKRSSTAKRTHRYSRPKSTPSSDDSSSVAASERPARSLRPASE